MKQLCFLAIYFGCVIVFLSSCSKSNDDAIIPELIVSTQNITLSNQGETKAFHIKSNISWTLSSSESWLTFSANQGQSGTTAIEVTASTNTNIVDRSAEITITVGDVSKKITVLQSASSLFKLERNEYSINHEVQELVFNVESNQNYTIEFNSDWLSRKSTPSVSGNNFTETILIKRNGNLFDRQATITLKKGNETVVATIIQTGNPLNIAANSTGVTSEATVLASKMILGWNLGNSLEAVSSSTSANETLWGNAKTTKTLIDAVKAAGFNAIRIPCAWSGYIEDQTTHKIKDSWLERVKEVVDYCVDNDMYVVLNIHWDGGWLEENPTYTAQAAVNLKQKALWEQIAVYFRDYDEHLIFAGTNEVHADYGIPTNEHITVQLSYNQTFVNAVRSTGGRNAYRNLAVQSYNTNIQQAVNHLVMPQDLVEKRLFAEVHFYDPYDFTLDNTSNKYLWGKDFIGHPNVSTWGQESVADAEFDKMKINFVDKGIPVILGEYGATLRDVGPNQADHLKSRNYYFSYVTKAAKDRGITPFYWDSGFTGTNGSGLFNRSNGQIVHQDAVNAIVNAIK
jgi:endoglucanase